MPLHFSISFIFALLSFFAAHAAPLRLMIDPGHGGIDNGATRGALKESDVVLDVAVRLRDLLKSEPGFDVSLTREKDSLLALPERMKKAEDARADLFMSLHANSAPDPHVKGLELFFQNSLPPDEDSQYLANLENQTQIADEVAPETDPSRRGDIAAIVEDLKRQSRIQNSLLLSQILAKKWNTERGGKGPAIKQAPFHVVSKSKMPSVLVELGFLTHPAEAKKLSSATYRAELAAKLKDALIEYRAQKNRLELDTP